jgi:hypothetical protein
MVLSWPTTRRLLTIIDAAVNANTKPAAVTTLPGAPMPRMIPAPGGEWSRRDIVGVPCPPG